MNTQLLYGETQPAPSLPPEPSAHEHLQPDPKNMMICLAICMGLQMTSFVMILPLFAHRLSEFGAGVSALGVSEMAYALAAMVSAPFMGGVADRFGRKPVLLFSLAVYVVAFTCYLIVYSPLAFILLRGIAGAFTAGLVPAAMGMVADLAPEDRRAQWLGILSGGASVGWIAGPILGGLLYDRWGFVTALLVSIGMATIAFLAAFLGIRETHAPSAPQPSAPGPHAEAFRLSDFRKALPAPVSPFAMILIIYFAVMFAYAFIEPRMMFYAYDDLRWSSSMLGLVMSTFGVALMLGEFGLGRLSDRLGRKPVIVAGLVLFSAQFIGLALSRSYIVIALSFVIAGLGNALFDPALSASVLDMAPSEHQSRLLGLKSTAGSIGNILGPALVVVFTPLLPSQGIFLVSLGMVFLVSVLATLAGGNTVRLTSPLLSRRGGSLFSAQYIVPKDAKDIDHASSRR